MGEKVINPQTGEIYELVDGEWQSTNRRELAGKMAAQGMGAGESFLVGAGRELSSMGAGIRNLYAQATGDQATQSGIAGDEAQASAYMRGAGEALPTSSRVAMAAGGAAPYLATIPLGLGLGGTAARGLAGLGESSAIGAALGGVKYSGDQATDALTGALLSGAGYGLGSLASRTVNMIRSSGAGARGALIDAANAGMTGKVIRAAQGLEAPAGSEVLLKIAHNLDAPHRALPIVAKYAALKAIQHQGVADALLAFAGAGGGRAAGVGGMLGGRVAPTL